MIVPLIDNDTQRRRYTILWCTDPELAIFQGHWIAGLICTYVREDMPPHDVEVADFDEACEQLLAHDGRRVMMPVGVAREFATSSWRFETG